MRELRECSLRTEQSIQKLLGGLDRLIVAQPPPPSREPESLPAQLAAAAPADDGITSAPAEEPATPLSGDEPPSRSRRWGIFG